MPISAQQSDTRYGTKNNDNWKYFYDIGFERGLYIPTGNNNYQSGNSFTLTGGYFFTDKLGVRSGISLITDLDGSDYYWKVPLLFSFRTKTFQSYYTMADENTLLSDFLFNFFLNLLPKRIELNVGTSLGYMTPSDSYSYIYRDGREIITESFDLSRKFASSLDANLRLSFPIWRFCLNVNMGISYLWTQNYTHKVFYPVAEEKIGPSLFGTLGVGATFRF